MKPLINQTIPGSPHFCDRQRQFRRHPFVGRSAARLNQHHAPGARHTSTLRGTPVTWNNLHVLLDLALERRAYRQSTRRMYKHLLGRFARAAGRAPGQVTEHDIGRYIASLARAGTSAHFLALNISALRIALDRYGNQRVTDALRTPRRPKHLPTVLSRDEVRLILCAAATLRDRLLLGLVYGCGLKVSEVCAVRWRDVDIASRRLHIVATGVADQRTATLPASLIDVLAEGIRCCPLDEHIFPGSREGSPITARTVALVLRKAAFASGIEQPVACMTLRHSYAVHSMESGASIRAVQQALGHRQLLTTLAYARCVPPPDVRSPLDTSNGPVDTASAWPGPKYFAPAPEINFGRPGAARNLFSSRIRTHSEGRYLAWCDAPLGRDRGKR